MKYQNFKKKIILLKKNNKIKIYYIMFKIF